MNSVVITNQNGKFGFDQVPIPQPGPKQLLIKVDSCVLNPSDILFMKGLYGIKLKLPFTPGWEGSGTIVEVGSDLKESDFKGKRVAFMK